MAEELNQALRSALHVKDAKIYAISTIQPGWPTLPSIWEMLDSGYVTEAATQIQVPIQMLPPPPPPRPPPRQKKKKKKKEKKRERKKERREERRKREEERKKEKKRERGIATPFLFFF